MNHRLCKLRRHYYKCVPLCGVSTKNTYKIGADTSVIAVASVFDGIAMIGKATRQDGEYPDEAVGGAGFLVEVYHNGDEEKKIMPN
jgi:hypothetical protein